MTNKIKPDSRFKSLKRNTLVKILAIGAVPVLHLNAWTKPIIKSVILPVHAQTSAALRLDIITDKIIVPGSPSRGGRDWVEIDIAFVEGTNIDANAEYSIIEGPTDHHTHPAIGEVRIQGGRYGRNQVFWYNVVPSPPRPNATYLITVKVQNSSGEMATVSFNVTFTGY